QLTLGPQNQTVVVNGGVALLQAETSDVETNISAGAIVAAPLNSRNFVQLSTLTPGVALPPGTVLPRINGGRPRTNEYLYDGISTMQSEPGKGLYFAILQ